MRVEQQLQASPFSRDGGIFADASFWKCLGGEGWALWVGGCRVTCQQGDENFLQDGRVGGGQWALLQKNTPG